MSTLRIVFAGTPEFAAVALKSLLTSGHEIVAVYTQPDRPAGRGRKLTPSPVKQLALDHQLPVEQPLNFKQQDTIDALGAYRADLMIVAAYGLLLPENVLNLPRYGCMNIHASLLPRWRGAAPIQRAILAGDNETGITIMQMDIGLDTGAMLLKKATPISQDDTAASLHDRLAVLGGEAMLEVLQQLMQNKLQREKQNDALACYARKLHKDEAWINWQNDIEHISRQIRAFNPWPIAQTQYHEDIIRIHAAAMTTNSSSAAAGEILVYDKSGLYVACQNGVLRIDKCQLPGARAMSVAELYNGHPQLFTHGTRFTLPPQT
jgi:methionyl-tRNA formyltransferase